MSDLKNLLGLQLSAIDTDRLGAEAMQAIAEELEEALADPSRKKLAILSEDLIEILAALVRSAPKKVQKTIRDNDSGDREVMMAFLIGQLGFAQHFASISVTKRAGDTFYNLMKDSRVIPYVSALFESDLASNELAKKVDARPETTSRNLKKMREAGIAEFRRDGVSVVNFLTPIARSAWESMKAHDLVVAEPKAVSSVLEEVANVNAARNSKIIKKSFKLPEYMLHQPIMLEGARVA